MPMVPGLSADMPSRVSHEDDLILPSFELYGDALLEEMNFPANADLSTLSEHLFDEDIPIPDAFPPNIPDEIPQNKATRDCLRGYTPEMCIRECGQDCDFSELCPFRYGRDGKMHTITSGEHLYRLCSGLSALPPQQPPYSPYNDHCYYQTIGFPESEMKETSIAESESLSDDSADEIVDVETVQDRVEPPINKVVKKRGRKPAKKLKFSKPIALNNKRTTIMKRGSKVMQPNRAVKGRRRGKSSCEPSSASSSDAEENGKRSNHNNMERHRRDEQKQMLQGLRVLIPNIKGNPKTPKVMILTEAAKFIFQLRNQSALLEQAMLTEKERYRRYLRIKKELSEDIIPRS